MESKEILGLVIAIVATVGGLSIGGIAVYVSVTQDMKTKQALLEAKNRERLALIERGMDPSILDKKKPQDGHSALLWGLLLCGIGLGSLIGYVISYCSGYSGIKESIMTNSLGMLLGGAGLILYYIIIRKGKDQNQVA
jgi:hypothetical protein